MITQLRENRTVVRPYLGIKFSTASPTRRGQQGQVRVVGVAQGSPAASAGVRAGDTIVQFDGKAVASNKDILERIGYEGAGGGVGGGGGGKGGGGGDEHR